MTLKTMSKAAWDQQPLYEAKNVALDFSINVALQKITNGGNAKVLVISDVKSDCVEYEEKMAKPKDEPGKYIVKMGGSMNDYVFKT